MIVVYCSNPTHVYSDTGVYKVRLTVSIGGFCTSSDSLIVKVYPGFFPNFTTPGPLCKGLPVSFADNTTSQFGIPTGWRWNFGNSAATNDTSNLQNPAYTFTNPGNYNVQLIVGNTFGCIDTITTTSYYC
jgi:PKD repeat protein